jgi:hypothetical protein
MARKLAETTVERALNEIAVLPDSKDKELLITWAKYVVNQDLHTPGIPGNYSKHVSSAGETTL